MANSCFFRMLVRGNKSDLEKVNDILHARYSYHESKLIECTAEKHLFRVGVTDYTIDDDLLDVSGECAWSVCGCMFDSDFSYYNQMKDLEGFMGTTLTEISKTYHVDIEVYSEELGFGFQEHYLVRNGTLEVSEEVPYSENYDEEREEYTPIGGFGEWQFSI